MDDWRDLFESLKYGFWGGIAGVPQHFGGLIDRFDGPDQSTAAQMLLDAAAEIRRKQEQYDAPDTLLEKIASGLGQAPGMVGEILPYAGAAGAAVGLSPLAAGGLGAAALGGALTFGGHGAADVFADRGSPEDILREAAFGAVEGGLFGGLGRAARTVRQPLLRALAESGVGGGVTAGGAAVRGGDAEDIAAAGAMGGLLGAYQGAKAKPQPIFSKRDIEWVQRKQAELKQRAQERAKRTDAGEDIIDLETASEVMTRRLNELEIDPKTGAVSKAAQDRVSREVATEMGLGDIMRMSFEDTMRYAQEKGLDKWVPNIEDSISLKRGDVTARLAMADRVRQSVEPALKEIEAEMVGLPASAVAAREALSAKRASVELLGRQASKFILEGSSELGRAMRMLQKIGRADGNDLVSMLGERKFTASQEMKDLYDQAVSENKVDVQKAIVDSFMRPKLWDKVYEMWIMGLLSNPTTHAVNIISNSTVQALEVASRFGAAAIEETLGRAVGRKPNWTFKAASQDAAARVRSIPMALSEAARSFNGRSALAEQLERYGGKSEQFMEAISGGKGKFIRAPGGFLAAEDAFFKTLAAAAEATKITTEKGAGPASTWTGANKILENIRRGEPDSETLSYLERIRKAAEDQTFTNPLSPTDESAIRRFGYQLDRMRKVSTGGGAQPGRVIIPFLRTPTNIVLYSLRNSPAGLTRAIKMARDNNPAYAQELARAGIGSLALGLVMDMAADGQITGGGPTDPNTYRNLRDTGWQPYSIKIGDTWVSYQRIEPLASIVGAAADLKEVGDEPVEDRFGKLVDAFKDNLTNKTFMLGNENMMNAWADPGRYGQNWIESMAASAVPGSGFLGAAARARDPYSRRIAGESADPIVSTLEAAAHGAMSRIPGLREELPVNYSITGVPTRYDTGMTPNQYAANVFNPFRVSVANEAPEAALNAELARLGQQGLKIPTPPSRTMTLPKELRGFVEGGRQPQKLTEEEYQLTAAAHRMAASMLVPIINTQAYQMLDDESKAEYINRLYTTMRSRVNPVIRGQMTRRVLGGK